LSQTVASDRPAEATDAFAKPGRVADGQTGVRNESMSSGDPPPRSAAPLTGEQVRRQSPPWLLLEIDVGERLTVGVADYERRRFPRPSRAAGRCAGVHQYDPHYALGGLQRPREWRRAHPPGRVEAPTQAHIKSRDCMSKDDACERQAMRASKRIVGLSGCP
jgi:hypothetical protein